MGDRFLILVAALAFGPPLVLAIRQLFADEMRSYLRNASTSTMLLAVIVLSPVIAAGTFLLVSLGIMG